MRLRRSMMRSRRKRRGGFMGAGDSGFEDGPEGVAAAGGEVDPDGAAVGMGTLALDEAGGLETIDEAGDTGGGDSQGAGEAGHGEGVRSGRAEMTEGLHGGGGEVILRGAGEDAGEMIRLEMSGGRGGCCGGGDHDDDGVGGGWWVVIRDG
jgi:hypothetical protein